MAKRLKFHPVAKFHGMNPQLLWWFMLKSVYLSLFGDKSSFTQDDVREACPSGTTNKIKRIKGLLGQLIQAGYVIQTSNKTYDNRFAVTEKLFNEADDFCQDINYFFNGQPLWPFSGFSKTSEDFPRFSMETGTPMFPGFKRLLLSETATITLCASWTGALPFHGTLQEVQKHYQNECALVRLTGNPDLHIYYLQISGPAVNETAMKLMPEYLLRYGCTEDSITRTIMQSNLPEIEPGILEEATKIFPKLSNNECLIDKAERFRRIRPVPGIEKNLRAALERKTEQAEGLLKKIEAAKESLASLEKLLGEIRAQVAVLKAVESAIPMQELQSRLEEKMQEYVLTHMKR